MAIPKEAIDRFDAVRASNQTEAALVETKGVGGEPRYVICLVVWDGEPHKSGASMTPIGEIYVGDVLDLFAAPDGAQLIVPM